MEGKAAMDALFSEIQIGSFSRPYLFSSPCSTIPARLSISVNGRELPSISGTSLASTSMRRLSNPKPVKAARICSTVCTSTWPSPRVVRRGASLAREMSTFISGFLGRSTRMNFTPLPTGAGLKVIVLLVPVWSPTPE